MPRSSGNQKLGGETELEEVIHRMTRVDKGTVCAYCGYESPGHKPDCLQVRATRKEYGEEAAKRLIEKG